MRVLCMATTASTAATTTTWWCSAPFLLKQVLQCHGLNWTTNAVLALHKSYNSKIVFKSFFRPREFSSDHIN